MDGADYDEFSRGEDASVPVSGMLLSTFIDNPRLANLRGLKVEPIEATAAQLLKFGESRLAAQLQELLLWVQFPDGSREDLRASKGLAKEHTTDFVTEHILRFRPESA